MNKHVRQMMIDLRLERQARHRDCTYRRCLLHVSGNIRYRGKKYHFLGGTNYFNRMSSAYVYHRQYNCTASFVRCSKTVNYTYMLKKHMAWACCNLMVEDTIRCAEQYRVSDPFDRREYQDLAIMELPLHSHN